MISIYSLVKSVNMATVNLMMQSYIKGSTKIDPEDHVFDMWRSLTSGVTIA